MSNTAFISRGTHLPFRFLINFAARDGTTVWRHVNMLSSCSTFFYDSLLFTSPVDGPSLTAIHKRLAITTFALRDFTNNCRMNKRDARDTPADAANATWLAFANDVMLQYLRTCLSYIMGSDGGGRLDSACFYAVGKPHTTPTLPAYRVYLLPSLHTHACRAGTADSAT